MDNLRQELVLARRDSGRLAKQLKVQIPPADVVFATPDLYRYIRTDVLPTREILQETAVSRGNRSVPACWCFLCVAFRRDG